MQDKQIVISKFLFVYHRNFASVGSSRLSAFCVLSQKLLLQKKLNIQCLKVKGEIWFTVG